MRLAIVLALLAASAHAPAARAAESYDNCTGTIATVPATISSQGVWCMKADLATGIASGGAIVVATNNVTIDCNGFKLGNLAAGTSTGATAIYAENRSNLTVRNCNLRGFYNGILVVGGGDHVIEDNRFDGNHFSGIYSLAESLTIRGNLLIDTGDSTLTDEAVAIAAFGFAHIRDNTVTGVVADGSSPAIGIFSGASGTIVRNRVSGVMADTGSAKGIFVNSNYGLVDDNYVYGDVGQTTLGIDCSSSSTVARDNVVSETVSGIANCDSYGNIIKL